MNGVELKAALHRGQRVYGTCVTMHASRWPGMIVATGVDFVFIDTEHTAIGRETLSMMCTMFGQHSVAPIVRIPEPDPFQATEVLDGGAAGIVAPYVETVEQVKALVGATKLRPIKGQRMRNVLDGTESLEPELKQYVDDRCAENVLAINIESVPAMRNLDDILKVPGLDAVLVGPHDLSCSLGIAEQWMHPQLKGAQEEIITKCRKANIGVGVHISYAFEEEIWCAETGANFIVHSSDISLCQDILTADLARFRKELGDQARNGDGEEILI
jgi:staphyloferrin B biosynthesis citrate synthase